MNHVAVSKGGRWVVYSVRPPPFGPIAGYVHEDVAGWTMNAHLITDGRSESSVKTGGLTRVHSASAFHEAGCPSPMPTSAPAGLPFPLIPSYAPMRVRPAACATAAMTTAVRRGAMIHAAEMGGQASTFVAMGAPMPELSKASV